MNYTVFYGIGSTCEEVKDGLVNHDGYNPDIIVEDVERKETEENPAFNLLHDAWLYLRVVKEGHTVTRTGAEMANWRGRNIKNYLLSEGFFKNKERKTAPAPSSTDTETTAEIIEGYRETGSNP